jgi:Uma2 family endonuclease
VAAGKAGCEEMLLANALAKTRLAPENNLDTALNGDENMSSATASVAVGPIPVEDHYEVVGGEYRELPPIGARETLLANYIAQLISEWTRPRNAGQVAVKVLVQLDREGMLQRRPDVLFVSTDRWPLDKRIPEESAWKVSPNLAVEVVSPTNTVVEIMAKVDDYFAHGVQRVWICLPKQRQVHVYTSPTTIRILDRGDTIRDDALFPGLEFEVSSLYPDRLS